MPAKKKVATTSRRRTPSVREEQAKFRRQSDLRALQEAEEVRGSAARLRGAKREAREQRRALDKISKK